VSFVRTAREQKIWAARDTLVAIFSVEREAQQTAAWFLSGGEFIGWDAGSHGGRNWWDRC
jgi:hypothetical protein